jgi:sodium-dependent dicarboxylate transporter 2/3/5
VSERSSKDSLKLLLGPLLFLIFALAPPLPMVEEAALVAKAPSPKAPQIALGGLLWVASWWVTEAVPLGLTGILAAVLFSLLGYVPWSKALTSFTNPIIWIFIGGFVLAAAFRKWGVDRRAALAIARLYKGGNPALTAFFAACLPAFLLTVTGSITASASVVFPIALSLLAMVRASDGYTEATMLALGEAATAGAMLLLISTPPNLIAKQVLESSVPGFKLTFLDWFIVGTPQAVVGLIVSWLVVFKLVKFEEKEVKVPPDSEEKPLSLEEKLVLAVFALTLTLWVLPGALTIAASFEPSLEPLASTVSGYLPEAAPATLAVLLLGLLRTGRGPLLTMQEISDGVDWNVVFMFGGGIAMGSALDASGFSQWLALTISSIGALDTFTLSAVAALLGFIITFPASNTASAMITAPLVASIARGAGVNPVAPVLSAALACSISSALPSTTPPMAIVYGSKKVRAATMFKVGILSDLLRLAILVATEPYLVSTMLALKRIP